MENIKKRHMEILMVKNKTIEIKNSVDGSAAEWRGQRKKNQ